MLAAVTDMAAYDVLADALGREPLNRGEVLAALARVPDLRRDLDDIERAAIDAARQAGASWGQVAAALGLRSRQAAEQRRLRLGAPEPGRRDALEARRHRRRQRSVDETAGREVVALRAAVRDLATAVDRVPTWDDQGSAAVLARRTFRIALEADPGTLVDLSRLALDDLAALGRPPAGGRRVADPLRRVRAIVDLH